MPWARLKVSRRRQKVHQKPQPAMKFFTRRSCLFPPWLYNQSRPLMKNVPHFTTKWNYVMEKKNDTKHSRGGAINVMGAEGPTSHLLIQGQIDVAMGAASHWRRSVAFGKQFAILIPGSNKQVRLWQKWLSLMKAWQRSKGCKKSLEIQQTRTRQSIMVKFLALASI